MFVCVGVKETMRDECHVRARMGVPCGWVCRMGGSAVWVGVPCGWVCRMGGSAVWVGVPEKSVNIIDL